ncbi:hypothetical protein PV04_02562 [Phialophora macrospora]|uniref:Uncharacterized protein n=1 Tax=Phialophora macrospora TaxID=1851006 RepID=A0A0D2E7H5_9EURO|nr:hypothetical protein PV04_02562 [Phialophora macrospora]
MRVGPPNFSIYLLGCPVMDRPRWRHQSKVINRTAKSWTPIHQGLSKRRARAGKWLEDDMTRIAGSIAWETRCPCQTRDAISGFRRGHVQLLFARFGWLVLRGYLNRDRRGWNSTSTSINFAITPLHRGAFGSDISFTLRAITSVPRALRMTRILLPSRGRLGMDILGLAAFGGMQPVPGPIARMCEPRFEGEDVIVHPKIRRGWINWK